VTSYLLEWDACTNNCQDIVGRTSSYLLTSFTITTGVSAGGSYAFRVSAYNAYGWSTPSVSVNIIASTYPNKMNVPST